MRQKTDEFVEFQIGKVNFYTCDLERFWQDVDKNGPLPDQSKPHYAGLDRCWVWTSYSSGGYGRFYAHVGMGLPQESSTGTHRISFVIRNGSIQKGKCVLHRCDNRACVNPDHLFLGTRADNNRDMDEKGRRWMPSGEAHHFHRNPELRKKFVDYTAQHPECKARGEAHGMSKLTDEAILEIRSLYPFNGGRAARTLAKKFGVSKVTIYAVAKNKFWKHVQPN